MTVRVAVDGRRLQDDVLGGVGRSIAAVLPHLAPVVDLTVVVDGRRRTPQLHGIDVVAVDAPRGVPELVWLELAGRWLRRQDRVFHGTFNQLPAGYTGRGVVTMHDLAPQRHPEDFGAAKRALWLGSMRLAARRAAVIVTVSAFVAREVVDHFGVSPTRVVVASHGRPQPPFSPSSATSHAAPPDLPERYVVALGGARRRGLRVAIDAWRRMRADVRDAPALVVVGERVRPEDQVHSYVGLHDDAWSAVLARADALCYPTRYEGYGLPAVEAAACGTPVVCAPIASLPEVLGDAAAWCAEPSVDAVATTLTRIVRDDGWRRALGHAGLARVAALPGWDATARQLLGAYERAAR